MKKIVETKKKKNFLKLLPYLMMYSIVLTACGNKEKTEEKKTVVNFESIIETETTTVNREDALIEPQTLEKKEAKIEQQVEEKKEAHVESQATVKQEEVVYEEPIIADETVETIQEETELEEVNERKLVALTFDDGPSKYTSELVDILNENGAHATFFVVGSRVLSYESYTNAVLKAYENGNEIGNHTYNHVNLNKLTSDNVINEIELTNSTLEQLGITATVVRAPGGNANSTVLETVSYPFIYWSVDSEDWKSRNVESIKKEILNAIDENGIILCHDLYSTTIEAIRELLPELSEEYEFVTVSELFRRNDLELLPSSKQYVRAKTK